MKLELIFRPFLTVWTVLYVTAIVIGVPVSVQIDIIRKKYQREEEC